MTAAYHSEFARQHASLKGDIERIKGHAACCPSMDHEQGAMVTELKSAISALRGKLRIHFAFEEEDGGGYMLEVTTVRPTLRRKVERLRSDHDVILAALDELVASSSPTVSPETLTSSFVEAIRYLRRHEIEEMDLVQETLSHDLGVCD